MADPTVKAPNNPSPDLGKQPERPSTPQQPLTREQLALRQALAQSRLAQNTNKVQDALDTFSREADQRQEQQLYSSTWAGWVAVMTVIVDTSATKDELHRKSMERIRNEMFEMLAKEEKKRKLRDSPFFQQLVSTFGESAAESVTQKLESASASGSGLTANRSALAQLAKEISTALERGAPQLKLTLDTDQLAKALEREIERSSISPTKGAIVAHTTSPNEALAAQTHERLFAVKTGAERVQALTALRNEVGAERFSAMIDAYDARHGVPLIAHCAHASSSSTKGQSELISQLKGLLSQDQLARLTEFGRAEFAQSLARVDVQRKQAEHEKPIVENNTRMTAMHLANDLGKPELAMGSLVEVRAKLLSELARVFPELKGKDLEHVAARLREVGGERDDRVAEQGLKKLLGASPALSTADAKELVVRAANHLQSLIIFEQQALAISEVLSAKGSKDEQILREHFTKVYGAEATVESDALTRLRDNAAIYFDHLKDRISDPSLGTEERDKLIRERDRIEFEVVHRLAIAALEEQPPQAQRALSLLASFANDGATSERRRSVPYLEAARALSEGLRSAETLRQCWTGLNSDALATVKLEGPGSETQQRAALASQREQALSNRWFAQVIDNGLNLQSGIAPSVRVAKTAQPPSISAAFDTIERSRQTMDAANSRVRTILEEVQQSGRSPFLSAEHLKGNRSELSQSTLQKLGASTTGAALSALSRELDHGKQVMVSSSALEAARGHVERHSPLGEVLERVQRRPGEAEAEYLEIQAQLPPADALRFQALVLAATVNDGGGGADGIPSWSELSRTSPEDVAKKLPALASAARLARLEAMTRELSEEENEELLSLFEATARRSMGQALIQGVPLGDDRAMALTTLARSRLVRSGDLTPFFEEPVPLNRDERSAILARYLQEDLSRQVSQTPFVTAVATNASYQYRTLATAAAVAAGQQQYEQLAEITSRMREFEARLQGQVVKSLSTTSAPFNARRGLSAEYRAAIEEELAKADREATSKEQALRGLARDVETALRSDNPRYEAAFNRIRQANLSEEETLLLRTLYSRQVGSHVDAAGGRRLTGDLKTDLQNPEARSAADRSRIEKIAKGGAQALVDSDVETLRLAVQTNNEELQLQTLSNLRATGTFEKAQGRIPGNLAPAAQSYNQAVTSGDKLKADVADVAIKARNGDLKSSEVAAFLTDKSPQDMNRISQVDPAFLKAIQSSNPGFFDPVIMQMFSAQAAERQKGLERAMLKTLNDPEEFARWLNVGKSAEERASLLRNLESLVERQPNAPKFVTTGDPLKDEPKIVQYVRAQRTDFREIDAYLIKSIIVSTLSSGNPLDQRTLDQIRKLRVEAAAQLAETDVLLEQRTRVVQAARDVKAMYDGALIWAKGDPVLKGLQYGSLGGLFQSSSEVESITKQRTARMEELARLYPNLAGRTDRQLERGELGLRWHFLSGYLIDDQVALSEKRLAAQTSLLAPLERALLDINQSRELMRATFGLRAKDAIDGVFRGLTTESTTHAMALLRQRDAKIVYRVTDQKAHEEWVAITSKTETNLAKRDFFTNLGISAAKVVTVVAVTATGGPLAGFVTATAFNIGDKVRRRIFDGESWEKLSGEFMFELFIDSVLVGASWKSASVTVSGPVKLANGTRTITSTVKYREPMLGLKWIQRGIGKITGRAPTPIPAALPRGGTPIFPKDIPKLVPSDKLIGDAWWKFTERYLKASGNQQPLSAWVTGSKTYRMGAWRSPNGPSRGSPLPKSPDDDGGGGRKKPPHYPSGPFGPPPTKPIDPPHPVAVVKPPDRPNNGAAGAVSTPPAPDPKPAPSHATLETPPVIPVHIAGAGPNHNGAHPLAGDPSTTQPTTITPSPGTSQSGPSPTDPTNSGQPGSSNQPPAHGGGPPPPSAGGGEGPRDNSPGGPSDGAAAGRGILVGGDPARSLQPTVQNEPQNIPSIGQSLGVGVGVQGQLGEPAGQFSASPVAAQVPNPQAASNSLGLGIPEPIAVPRSQSEATANALPTANPMNASIATPTPRVDIQSQLMQNAAATAQLTAHPPHAERAEAGVTLLGERQGVAHAGKRTSEVGEQLALLRKRESPPHSNTEKHASDQIEGAADLRMGKIVLGVEGVAPASVEEIVRSVAQAESYAGRSEKIHSKEALSEELRDVAKVTDALQDKQSKYADGTSEAQQQPSRVRPGDLKDTPEESRAPVERIAGKDRPRDVTFNAQPHPVAAPENRTGPPSQQPLQTPVALSIQAPTAPANIPLASSSGSAGDNGDSPPEVGGGSLPRKKTRRGDMAKAARAREIILQQLMAQHLSARQRDKLLKALVELGISESEYRSLVAKLGEMEVQRLAQAQAAKRSFAEPLAVAQEAPRLKPAPKDKALGQPAPQAPKATTTRAELYQRLKAQGASKKHTGS